MKSGPSLPYHGQRSALDARRPARGWRQGDAVSALCSALATVQAWSDSLCSDDRFYAVTSHQRLDCSGVTLALLQTVTEADPHPGPDPDLPLASQLSRHFPFSYVNYWSEVLVSKQLSTININNSSF